jgi:hypothetical protein
MMWRTIAVVMFAVCAEGCARRQGLTAGELAQLDRRAAADDVRVYVSKRLIAEYPELAREHTMAVDREIRVRTRERPLREIVGRGTAGQVVGRDAMHGAPRLWVAFAAGCEVSECAYGFVQTEDGQFRLASLPRRAEYREPAGYRGGVRSKRRLQPGRRESLAEANEVLVVRRGEKALTIDLEVKKDSRERRRARVVRASGR